MAQSTCTPSAPVTARHKQSFSSIITLASWRLRRTWFLLLIVTLGMIAAITVVCVVPLLATVTTTAGLRGVITAPPTNSQIVVKTSAQGLSTKVIHDIQQQTRKLLDAQLAAYLSEQSQLFIKSDSMTLVTPKPARQGDQLQLFGTSMQEALPHLALTQGRLPQANSGELELALTSNVAAQLRVKIGDSIVANTTISNKSTSSTFEQPVKMRLVGLVTLNNPNDPFWQGNSFQPQKTSDWTNSMGLTASDAFIATIDRIAQQQHTETIFSSQGYTLQWIYTLDTSRLLNSQLSDLIAQLDTTRISFENRYRALSERSVTALLPYPYLLQASLSGFVFSANGKTSVLDLYSARIAAAQIPMGILSLQIVALILLFISLMVEQLVDRQEEAIAILRSRGASGQQVLGALLTQGVGLCILALCIAPPLSLLVVLLVGKQLLTASDQSALNIISAHPLQALLSVASYALLAAGIVMLTLLLSLRRAAGMDVLSIRREAARTTKRPLWQRLYLDIIAALTALIGYGISVYLTNVSSLLDVQTRALVFAPLSLIAPLFILIAAVLLFLRLFPLLLNLGARLAGRGRGASSMLALAQMARSPRQGLRMTLLLSLATAFAIFTLVFTASQAQRAQDIAAYQTGADLSGALPATIAKDYMQPEAVVAAYKALPGVTAASTGLSFESSGTTSSQPIEITINAVDSPTFAQTVNWPTQTASGRLEPLMKQLAAQQLRAEQENTVPVIVDTNVWNAFNLTPDATFILDFKGSVFAETANNSVRCRVVERIEHMPTINDSEESEGDILRGGILADYESFVAVYQQSQHPRLLKTPPVNHLWLRTSNDQAQFSALHTTLQSGSLRLFNILDRREQLARMQSDPLYLSITGLLTIGALTTLFLSLLGSLLISWLSARLRLTSFAILRALGTSPRQVAGLLTWEQTIIYLTAVVLGVAFGALLSATIVPTLVFATVPVVATTTDVLSENALYALQRILPPQVVLPFSLAITFVLLVVICSIALGLMIRIVSQPSLAQTLRGNED